MEGCQEVCDSFPNDLTTLSCVAESCVDESDPLQRPSGNNFGEIIDCANVLQEQLHTNQSLRANKYIGIRRFLKLTRKTYFVALAALGATGAVNDRCSHHVLIIAGIMRGESE